MNPVLKRLFKVVVMAFVLTGIWRLVSGCGGVVDGECRPVTSCSTSTCGVLPDGCGGVIRCGDCADPRTLCYFSAPAYCHGSPPFATVEEIASDPADCAAYPRSCQ